MRAAAISKADRMKSALSNDIVCVIDLMMHIKWWMKYVVFPTLRVNNTVSHYVKPFVFPFHQPFSAHY